jgi:hypothetical protein
LWAQKWRERGCEWAKICTKLRGTLNLFQCFVVVS